MEVVNLIPSKSTDNSKNNLYVKNFPYDLKEEDLKKLFEKYGEVSSVVISRDDKGNSRGFGFVCFKNSLDAAKALKEIKIKSFTFTGCNPLFVNFAQKKEERQQRFTYPETTFSPKLLAKLMIPDLNIVNSPLI